MAMIKCPECGTEISTRALNCIKCGLPMSEIFVCPECNNVMLRDNNTMCDKCGCPIDSLQTIENNPALELNINISKPQEDEALSELNYLTTCERIIHKVLLNNPLNGVGLYYEGGNPISDSQKVNAVKIAFNIPKNDNVFLLQVEI